MQKQPASQSNTVAHAEAWASPAQPSAEPRQLHWAAVAGIVLAQVLAYLGEVVLARTDQLNPREGLMQALAGGLLLTAAVLFGAATRRLGAQGTRLEPRQAGERRPAFGWLLAALAFSTAAIGLFAARGESRLVVLGWLAGMAALLGSQLWGRRAARPQFAPGEWRYLAALALLLLVALASRVYRLTTLPYNFDGDFASVGLQARALLRGDAQQIFAYGWASIPMLGYSPAWLSMALFGDSLAGLNASGVIDGLLIIAGVYLLGRELFHARVGLLAAALLTVSYTHMAASRQASYLDPVAALVFAIYLLLAGLRHNRGWALVVSGMLSALCIQLYYSGRLVLAIVGFVLLYLLLFQRAWLWERRRALALWALALLIATGPMLVLFARNSDALMARTREVFIFSPEIITHEQGVYQVSSIGGILLQQARRTALLFFYYDDTSTQYALRLPFLDPLAGLLFTLGVGYALAHWRRLGEALVLGWAGLSLLIGCFLTANPPFWPRLLVLLPPSALLAALALDLLYERLQLRLGPWLRRGLPVALALLLAASGWRNWSAYAESRGTWATPRTQIARYLAELPPTARAYLISNNFKSTDREFEFLAPGRFVANLAPDQLGGTLAPAGSPTLVILAPDSVAMLPELQRRFPGAPVEPHTDPTNAVVFYVARL